MRILPLSICLALVGAAPGAELSPPRFTKQPTATRAGDKVKIEFSVDRETDVAVFIENANGKVVRHLVAGVLGKNPPAPLKANSLAQSIEWDGKADAGGQAEGGPFKARVAVALTPRFDGFLLYEPDATPSVHSLAVGPKGNVYAFYKDPTANGNQGGLKIKVLDRDGRHVKMLMPFPAEVPYERVRALGAFRDEDGRLVPRIYNWHTLSFYPDPQIARRRSMSPYSLPVVDAKGAVYWIVSGVRLAALDADAGVPYETFLSEPLTGQFEGAGAMLPSLAVSGDGKHLYLSGLGHSSRRDKQNRQRQIYTPFPCVLRIDTATRKAASFAGQPAQSGKEEGLLAGPRGLAVADGLLYVADPGADRIAVFKESDGGFVGEVKVKSPQTVSVDPKTGAIYTCVYTGSQTGDLVKLDGYRSGKELYRVSMPKTGLSPNAGTLRVVGDFSQRPPRLWVPGIAWGRSFRRLGYYEDTGEKFVATDLVAMSKPWGNGPRDLLVDRARGELYIKVSGEQWYRLNERTGERVGLVKFRPSSGGPYMSCHGAQLGVEPAGNLITHCWGERRGLMRWTRDGKALNWQGQETNRTEWGGMMTFQLNYMALRGDDIYLIKAVKGPHHLDVYDLGLKKKRRVVWNARRGSCPRVDAKGNIYITVPIRPADRDFAEFFDGKIEKVPDYFRNIGEGNYWYTYMAGAIVKFPPTGGAFYWTGDGRAGHDISGLPAEIAAGPKVKFQYFLGGRYPHRSCEVQGAEWVRFGYSPYSETYSAGTPVCMCEGTGFDVDPFGRVFFPNLCRFRVEVIDTRNSRITEFGRYGNQDDTPSAIPLAWPTYVAVSDTHAYVNDTINMRVTRVKLGYAAEETCPVK